MNHALDPRALTAAHAQHLRSLQAAYERAMDEEHFDAVVIHSGAPLKKSLFDDQYHPLRATPHFQHWIPLVTPRSALLIRKGHPAKLLWNNHVDFWEGPTEPESSHFWALIEVAEGVLPEQVPDHLRGLGRVAYIGDSEADAATFGLGASRNPAGLLAKLDELRVFKSEYERICLAEANRRACLGHAAVLAAFRSGEHSELDLHLIYLRATEQDDADTPYKNIVALDRHAATLHHVSYGRSRERAQSLLLDAGARFLGYDSDITRTAVKGNGEAATVFGALIAKMETLQTTLCAEARTHVMFEDLHDRTHALLAEVLREVGIARGSASELVAQGVTRKFLPHGLGHSLGLQTHDVGCARIKPRPENPFLRNTRRIEPGQVFTIEPGCYFIEPLLDELRSSSASPLVDWKLVDSLRSFGGVRIEDDLAVSESTVHNLTRRFLQN